MASRLFSAKAGSILDIVKGGAIATDGWFRR